MIIKSVVTLCLTIISVANGQCDNNQTRIASIEFKDCMDQKQASLLQTNLETDNSISVFCDGLEQFSLGCEEPINRFSNCKTRQYVDNLVAIHIDSMAG